MIQEHNAILPDTLVQGKETINNSEITLHAKSKKIQKKSSKDYNNKKYKAFENSQKTMILLSIQKKVLQYCNRKDVEELDVDLLLVYIEEKLPKKEYNRILGSILKVFVKL